MHNYGKSRSRGFNQNRSFNRGSRRAALSKHTINPALFINKAVEACDQAPEQIEHQFSDFSLDERLLQRVSARNYTTPTPIQDKGIPLVMAGRDVIGIADTGTGKTAAFLLPFLHKIIRDRSQKVLIIVPTRELATQIDDELKQFSRGLGVFSALCIGGNGMGAQIKALRNRPQFIIGTPGRLKDHITRRSLRLYDVTNLVLDEADRMVEMGFLTAKNILQFMILLMLISIFLIRNGMVIR